jgi:hypothetical protein
MHSFSTAGRAKKKASCEARMERGFHGIDFREAL